MAAYLWSTNYLSITFGFCRTDLVFRRSRQSRSGPHRSSEEDCLWDCLQRPNALHDGKTTLSVIILNAAGPLILSELKHRRQKDTEDKRGGSNERQDGAKPADEHGAELTNCYEGQRDSQPAVDCAAAKSHHRTNTMKPVEDVNAQTALIIAPLYTRINTGPLLLTILTRNYCLWYRNTITGTQYSVKKYSHVFTRATHDSAVFAVVRLLAGWLSVCRSVCHTPVLCLNG